MALQEQITRVHIDAAIKQYIVAIVRATRNRDDVILGASPRASLALMRAAQAYAFLGGNEFIVPQMVKDLAPPILCHRIIVNPQAALSGASVTGIIEETLASTPVPMRF